MYVNHLYLLVTKNHSMFKIGVTTNPKIRVRELSRHFDFDFKKSYLMPCYAIGEASYLEDLLLKHFTNFNLEDIPKFDGSNDFFSMECFELIIPFIYSNSISTAIYKIKSIKRLPSKIFNDRLIFS